MSTKTTLKSYAGILLIAVPFLLFARSEYSPVTYPSPMSVDENFMDSGPTFFWWQEISYTPNYPDSGEIVSYTAQDWPNGVEIDPLTGIMNGIAIPIGDIDFSTAYNATVTANYTDGTSLSRDFGFLLVQPLFNGFTLINASTNLAIGGLFDGGVIDINATGASLNITADPNFIGSAAGDEDFDVTFTLNGKKFSKESFYPYALAGDISRDYLEWSFSPGEYTIKAELNATALGGQIVATSEIRFSINPPNENAPLITGISGDIPQYWGQEVDLQVEASDPNGDALTYSATGLPSDLSINSSTGRITGSLSLNTSDDAFMRFSPTITATDPDGLSGSRALQFSISHPYITSFTLIDADTNTPIPDFDPLDSFDTNYIVLSVVGANLNIRANTNIGPVSGGAVKFELDGAPFGTENVFPYALAGDIAGDYLNWTPSPGMHTISAEIVSKTTGFSFKGPSSVSIHVTLDAANIAPEITSITGDIPEFWGEASHLQIEAFDPNGDVLTYGATGLPPNLSIDPITGRIYGCLSLDSGAGSSTGYSATLTVTDPDGLSESTTLEFFILQPYIESFTLIDADRNTPVPGFDPMDSSGTNNIDLNVVGANLNIRANTNIGGVCGGAVKFELDGAAFGTENIFPYALAGDIAGDYLNWTPSTGMHTITAQIASQATGNTVYVASKVSINVISGSSKAAANTIMYPNPSKDFIQFNFQDYPKDTYEYRITSIGNSKTILEGVVKAANDKVDIHSLPQGLYIIELTSKNSAYRNQFKLLKD